MTVSLSDRIEEIQRDLSMMEQAYERSKLRVAGKDQEWNERKAMLIRQIAELLSRYKIGDEPHKAVAIVAQASMMAAELRMPEHWVEQYEEKRQLLLMAQKDRDRIESSEQKAKASYENQPWRRAANS